MKKHIVIIGAGPCGLGALWQLQKQGTADVHVYEQSNHPGGVSSTFVDSSGFLWDIGGHILATKNETFINQMHTLYHDPLKKHARSAWVRIGPTMVPYPIQYSNTDAKVKLPHKIKNTSTFYHWINQSFEKDLVKTFFLPFNKKLWKYPLTKISTTWIKNKIPQYTKDYGKRQWGGNALFYYPTYGGIGSIWKQIADDLAPYISYNKRVIAIDATNHTILFSNHSKESYDELLSTIPLPSLALMVKGIDINNAATLPYMGVAVVGIGLGGKPPKEIQNCHWIYIADKNIPYFRVSVYSNYGVGNAPQGTWSLLFETTIDPRVQCNTKNIIETTITHAREQGLIPDGAKIISTFYHHEPFAYPTPIIGRDRILAKVNKLLKQHNIYCRGRFGSWKYEEGNMDDVWMQGVAWAASI